MISQLMEICLTVSIRDNWVVRYVVMISSLNFYLIVEKYVIKVIVVIFLGITPVGGIRQPLRANKNLGR